MIIGGALGIKNLPEEDRPREKLSRRGHLALSDGELLGIVLATGVRQQSAVALGDKLLCRFGGLTGLLQAHVEELQQVKGVGAAKAARVAAALELGRRAFKAAATAKAAISCAADVAALVMADLRFGQKEEFRVLMLNTKNQVLEEKVISVGTLNASLVHPRELFRDSIRRGAAALVLIHNHPSGDPAPSQDDIALTRRLVAAGKLLGIEVLDHVIVGDNTFVSLRDQGYL